MRFVLVHGAGGGAWCWEHVAAELTGRGHIAVAVDLPGGGARAGERAGVDGYRDAVLEVMEPGDILVGHSMGGFVISIAADAAPQLPAHLIYLAAGVPAEGASMLEAMSLADAGLDHHVVMVETEHGPAFHPASANVLAEVSYNDCDRATVEQAFARRVPQQLAPATAALNLPRFWSSSIPRTYVICTRDRSGTLSKAEEFMDRLGVRQAAVIDGSHESIASRPARVADVLIESATA
ncbi:alpha/beta fold hydrolase [Nocardia farcinica]|uniref:alpha/beta fold hydrolase n=1 Tax=Nocardia farcinica TaxID=37329 RepID=UPI0018958A30|nr:alpha/beta fold hydrolase [Nocardia farcinica]MBF6359853.1 alpha/beta fold hydrolase [Nocardia farcinica]